MLPEDVAVEIVADDQGAARRGCRTTLRLSWRKSDPLAVNLLVRSTPDHPALPNGNWVVLRDFLRYGLEEATGDGAVRLRPDAAKRMISLRLARHGRPTWVSAPASTIRTFLDRTEEILPSGEESSEDALDALIERLLER